MDQSELSKKLKEVNIQVSELFKGLKETDDRETIQILVTELANHVYMTGLADGRNETK